MSTYITKLYDRLDKICYARYGSTDNDIVEWVIEQNYGIELRGVLLPIGITINLPEAPRQLTQAPVVPQLFLWK
jgi:phage tail protein X